MKLGIITFPHNEQGIKRVAELGLHYAEFDINGDISGLDRENIKNSLEKYNVKLGAVGRWGRNRILPDGSINQKELEDEFFLIDFCRYTGCPVYITGCNYVEELSLYENYTSSINYLKSLKDYAGEDIKICTYNCGWNNYIYDEKAWNVVNSHLGIGIKYDPSHCINRCGDYIKEITDYGQNVYHIHLKGTINVGGVRVDDPPAGLDSVNWGLFLSVFQKHGYDGMLSIEPHSDTWQGELGDKGVKYTINYFRSLPFITE